MPPEPTPSEASARVVVVGTDEARLDLYRAALEAAQLRSTVTAETDEAEAVLSGGRPPFVLVLDPGLPRLATFRLYGLAREDDEGSRPHIIFVGQAGETGPDDHYLPGEPSPREVTGRVAELMARLDAEASATDAAVAQDVRSVEAAQAISATPSIESPPVALDDAPTVSASGAAAAAPPTEVTLADQESVPPPRAARFAGQRLDVVMMRVGLILLILGVLLILVRMDWSSQPLTAPDIVPTPALPAANPSPAALHGTLLTGTLLTLEGVVAFTD